MPHTDALVVTVTVDSSTVQRVLVDQGSSAEVMFYSTYKSLVDQGSSAGSRVIDVEFVVVSSPSPYNIILGQTWLHGMKAVASTLYQVMKFIRWNGRQESLRGDQVQSKKCYVSTVTNKPSFLEVQCVETADVPVLEEVGLPSE